MIPYLDIQDEDPTCVEDPFWIEIDRTEWEADNLDEEE